MTVTIVYSLCAAISLAIAGLLVRSYLMQRARVLLWICVCFIGLAVNNLLLITDKLVLLSVDLRWPRAVSLFLSAAGLLTGLILESR